MRALVSSSERSWISCLRSKVGLLAHKPLISRAMAGLHLPASPRPLHWSEPFFKTWCASPSMIASPGPGHHRPSPRRPLSAERHRVSSQRPRASMFADAASPPAASCLESTSFVSVRPRPRWPVPLQIYILAPAPPQNPRIKVLLFATLVVLATHTRPALESLASQGSFHSILPPSSSSVTPDLRSVPWVSNRGLCPDHLVGSSSKRPAFPCYFSSHPVGTYFHEGRPHTDGGSYPSLFCRSQSSAYNLIVQTSISLLSIERASSAWYV